MKNLIVSMLGGVFGGFVVAYVGQLIAGLQAQVAPEVDKLVGAMTPSQKQAIDNFISAAKIMFAAAQGDMVIALNLLVAKYPELAPLLPALKALVASAEAQLVTDLNAKPKSV